jgi:hypothetical protein
MSRPYLKINSATYSYTTDIVTLDITALRLRGQSSFSITGGTTSTLTVSLSAIGTYNSTFTFSSMLDASTQSTSNSTVASTATITFSGTASVNTNVGFTLPGSVKVFGAGGYTFSATQSTSAALTTLLATMSFGSSGFSAAISGNSLVFSAPSGVYYNGYSVTVDKQAGLGSFTFSQGASFSGGSTTYLVSLSSGGFGTVDTVGFTV